MAGCEGGAMYTKFLVPLDGSRVAEQVLPYARFLMARLKVPVDLRGVIDLAAIAISVHSHNARYLSRLADESRRASETYLERISKTVPEVFITCSVETDKPEEAIIEKAAHDKRTLIAIATHERSGVKRWTLGSVTEKVVRHSRSPVLVARAADDDHETK